ncbi:MAG: hypothetical protein DRH10_03875, partial [Deltaproteobacteria bacterium]
EKDLDACIVYMNHPPNRWKHIRTTNIIERSFKEVKRRVKVMEQFPTEESCLPVRCLPAERSQAGTQTGIRILFTLLRSQNEIWEGKPIKGF